VREAKKSINMKNVEGKDCDKRLIDAKDSLRAGNSLDAR
jgi:hypothetical protein